jgi:hypothetical protein
VKDSEVLAKAEELLADGRRWVQGAYQSDHGYCLVGAVRSAVGPEQTTNILVWDQETRVRRSLIDQVRELFPDRVNGLMAVQTMNDHPDTTYEDVRTVMEKARIGLEEMGR